MNTLDKFTLRALEQNLKNIQKYATVYSCSIAEAIGDRDEETSNEICIGLFINLVGRAPTEIEKKQMNLKREV